LRGYLSSRRAGECPAPREDIAMARLHVTTGGTEQSTHELAKAIVIGRIAECDLMIPDTEISRRHCRVEPTHEGWQITDLGSKNGTLVGGHRVECQVLRDGDVIQVGGVKLTFRSKAPASRAAAKPLEEHELLAALMEDAPSPGELESGDTRRLTVDETADREMREMLRELAPNPADYLEAADPSAHDLVPAQANETPAGTTTAAATQPPKYRGPTSWGASLTPSTAVVPAARDLKATSAASKKAARINPLPTTKERPSRAKPTGGFFPGKLVASVKELFNSSGKEGADNDKRWHKRQLPKPALFALIGVVALGVAWAVYATLLAGPQAASARPPSAHTSTARPSDD
jgi:pSer/pThr/pTyr-binding forkhead associated (FHA) protein